MASSSILGLCDLYLAQKNELTCEATDILMSITSASRKESTLASETEKSKNVLKTEYQAGTIDETAYESGKDEIQNDYEMKLSVINTWEKELEMKKSNIETQAQEAQAYLDSYRSVLKTNTQKDYKYAQG